MTDKQYYIGGHIDREKSIVKTLEVISSANGNALQIFASNPRSAKEANIEKHKEEAPEIIEYCKKNNTKIVIHAPYTINLATELKNNSRKIDISDAYWIKSIISQLIASDIINSIGVVVHVGKYTKLTPEEGVLNMKMYITYIVKIMKELKLKSKLIIEVPAGAGTELLTDINDFVAFYNSFTTDEKKHLGICLDTAHVWSDGYDLEEAYLKIIEKNMKDLIVIHLNNSKKEKFSKADQHDYIFEGKIPLEQITNLLKMIKTNKHYPMIILETPSKIFDKEVNWVSEILHK
jgi:deoxyribonuclease-4